MLGCICQRQFRSNLRAQEYLCQRKERSLRQMETFKIPGVGRVGVEFEVRTFGLGNETMKSVHEVWWPDGRKVSCEVRERTALHLEATGVTG